MSAPVSSGGKISGTPEIPATDHGVLYGAGFFETFRTRSGVPVRLAGHLARLRAACARIGILIPVTHLAASASPERWNPVVSRLLAENGLKDGVFRLTLTAGPNVAPLGTGAYAAPQEIITCRALPPEAPPEGITLRLLHTVRDTGEWSPRPKSLNYLNTLLASRELAPLRRHPADEGLLCDARGFLSEGVFSNIFWVNAGVVFTPAETTGCLPGIGRALVMTNLRASGICVKETESSPAALLDADAMAMVSCVRGVVPVARITATSGETYWKPGDAAVAALEPLFAAFP